MSYKVEIRNKKIILKNNSQKPYRACQGHTQGNTMIGDDRSVQDMTGAYSGTQEMTGYKWALYSGTQGMYSENTGDVKGKQGVFIRTVLEPVV